MNVINWLSRVFSSRIKPLAIYTRGGVKAKKHDHRGAIEDFTTVIGMADTTAEMIARAHFARALAYVEVGEHQKGIEDLDALLKMGDAGVNLKTMARQKLARIEFQSRNTKVS